MKKSFFIFLILFFLAPQCKKSSDLICNSLDPLQNLFWLKQMKDVFDFDRSGRRQSIKFFIYNNQHVFKISNCDGCADELTTVYNCEGKKICEFGGIAGLNTCPDFEDKSTFIKTLYDQ